MFRHDALPSDLKDLLKETLTLTIREDNAKDATFIATAVKEKQSQKRSAPTTSSASAALNSLSSKLDDFLNMMEEDEEEETLVHASSSKHAVETVSEPFTCALCHSSNTDTVENTPVLLCHVDCDRVPRASASLL